MIKTIVADGRSEFEALAGLAGRGGAPGADVEQAVRQIIDEVRSEGDAAVVRLARRFDGPDAAPGGRIGTLARADLKRAFESLEKQLADALIHAAENIRAYHKKQADALKGYEEKYGDGENRAVKPEYGCVDCFASADLESAESGIEMSAGRVGERALCGDEDGQVVIGQVVRGLERVGIYVPGGTAAYPSTVLMNAIPAKLAGVGEIVMVTPPRTAGDGERGKDGENCESETAEYKGAHRGDKENGIEEGGECGEGFATDAAIGNSEAGVSAENRAAFATDAAILGAAYIAGVDRVILAGGGQAVAALAYGTETFPRVDKIVGPGNIYVATAKRLLYGVVDIDMIAGPSEILIIADEGANAAFAAADMLSQAEHDPDAASILLTTSPEVAAVAAAQIKTQLESLSRAATASLSIAANGLIIVCRSEDEMIALADEIAPEHLEILTADPFGILSRIKNAGSVFLGPWTPEPVGDYYSGTNHVLPTSGTARFASPLGVYDFVKRMSYTRYTKEALKNARADIIEIANAEGLTAHANAVKIRF
jgi:histidinol dehydrogenase